MRTAEENLRLAGKEFNLILQNDPELKRLGSLQYDKTAETRILLADLGMGRWNIGSLPVMPLTPAKWAFLWILDNRFICGGEIIPEDADVFLYVLSRADLRKLDLPLHAIPGAASGYALATGLQPEELRSEINEVIHDALRPLEVIPPEGASPDEVHYDTQWLTRICGIAACRANLPMPEVVHTMPFSSVCCHFVNHLTENSRDPQKYRRYPDDQTLALMDVRFEQLADEFLNKKE